MRQKNVLRAAEALFVSQGDDKNKVLASFIDNKDVRTRVKDQGRALLILERLVLPTGKFSYTKEEMNLALLKKLEKKGHRIQEDDAEDDEQYAQEKEQFVRERQEMVSDILGKTVADLVCGEPSPIYGYSCVLDKEHENDHETSGGVKWENRQEEPEAPLTEEEQEQLKEALEIQKRLLPDLPEVREVEDSHAHTLSSDLPYGQNPGDHTQSYDFSPEVDLPEVAWQLIGQAYIDGIRTGRNSA